MRDAARLNDATKYGMIISVTVAVIIAALMQIFAEPISALFALTADASSIVSKADIIQSCETALHIATLGYAFMGLSVAVQGILQGFRRVYSPLIISALRLLVFPLPAVFLLTLGADAATLMWWAFPISEALTAAVAVLLLRYNLKKLSAEV